VSFHGNKVVVHTIYSHASDDLIQLKVKQCNGEDRAHVLSKHRVLTLSDPKNSRIFPGFFSYNFITGDTMKKYWGLKSWFSGHIMGVWGLCPNYWGFMAPAIYRPPP